MSMPQWMTKYPCPNCGAGYGECRDFACINIKCCKDCAHPEHAAAQPDTWTANELEEMWAGREMPEHVTRIVRRLRATRGLVPPTRNPHTPGVDKSKSGD